MNRKDVYIIQSICMLSSDWYQIMHTLICAFGLTCTTWSSKTLGTWAVEVRRQPWWPLASHCGISAGREDSNKVPWLSVFCIDRNYCALWIVCLKRKSTTCLRSRRGVILLVVEIRWAWIVSHNFTVGWWWPFHSAIAAIVGCTDSRIAARWAGTPIVHRYIY